MREVGWLEVIREVVGKRLVQREAGERLRLRPASVHNARMKTLMNAKDMTTVVHLWEFLEGTRDTPSLSVTFRIGICYFVSHYSHHLHG